MSAPAKASGYGILRLFFNLLVVGIVGFIGWTIYSQKKAEKQAAADQNTIMVVKYVGGLCAGDDGKGEVCSGESRIHNDGTFDGYKPLTDAEVVQLKNMINATDFTSYKEKTDPRCPSFSDGQDLVVSFPQKYVDKSFTVCRLDIPPNDPSFNLINDLIASHQKA